MASSEQTTKRHLNKPQPEDFVNVINDICDNMDNLDDAVPDSRKVNGHALNGDITVSKSDVGLGNVDNVQQVPATRKVNNKPLSSDINLQGTDIQVSSSDSRKVDAAIANCDSETASLKSAINDLEEFDKQKGFSNLRNQISGEYSPFDMSFVHGQRDAVTGRLIREGYDQRVASVMIFDNTSERIYYSVASGFRMYLCVWQNGTFLGGSWHTGYGTIGTGLSFAVTIARETENESEIADFNEFISAVSFCTKTESIATKSDGNISANIGFRVSGDYHPFDFGFIHGQYDPSNGYVNRSLRYRIASQKIYKIPNAITLFIASGFRLHMTCWNNGSFVGANWYTEKAVIPQGYDFVISIARATDVEDVSEIADINEFVNAITCLSAFSAIDNAVLLVDKTSETTHGYVANDGTVVPSDNYRRKGFTGLKGGEKYLYNGFAFPDVMPIATFYNASNQIIGRYTMPSTPKGDYDDKRNHVVLNEEITAPDGTRTVVFNWWYRYDNFVMSLYQVDRFVEHEQNLFQGIKLCINGDSVSTQDAGRWPVMLRGMLPIGAYKNIAVGGTQIIGEINSQERVNRIPTDTEILITGGTTNDWAKNASIGSMETLDDDTTLYGALHLYFQRLHARVPNALKIMFSNSLAVFPGRFPQSHNPEEGNYNNLDLPMLAYARAVKDVCEFDSILYIPVLEECGINIYNYETYVSDETDQTKGWETFAHPNAAGAELMTKVFLDYLYRYWNRQKNY